MKKTPKKNGSFPKAFLPRLSTIFFFSSFLSSSSLIMVWIIKTRSGFPFSLSPLNFRIISGKKKEGQASAALLAVPFDWALPRWFLFCYLLFAGILLCGIIAHRLKSESNK